MISILILHAIVLVVACVKLAQRHRLRLKGLLPHPLIAFAIFHVFISMDFIVLITDLENGLYTRFSRIEISDLDHVYLAATVYMVCSLIAVLGLYFGLSVRTGLTFGLHSISGMPDERRSALYTLVITGTLVLVLTLPPIIGVSQSHGALYFSGVRTIFFRANGAAAAASMIFLPAVILYISQAKRWDRIFIVAIFALIFYFFSGSRGSMLFVIISIVFKISLIYRVRLRYLVVAIPVSSYILIYYSYTTRFLKQFSDFDQVLEKFGGVFGIVFRSLEMSIAEAMTVHLSYRIAERGPFDSLIAGVFAYVPRDIIPWKPFGISSHLTMAADPFRWMMIPSEWTVSGYTNAIYEMGYPIGFLFVGLIFFCLGLFINAAASSRQAACFAGVIAAFFIFGYVRGDFYNLAMRIWSVVLLLLIYRSFFAVSRLGFRRSKSLSRQRTVDAGGGTRQGQSPG